MEHDDVERHALTLKAIILAYLNGGEGGGVVAPGIKDAVWASAAAKVSKERLRSKSSLGFKAPEKK